MKVLSIIVTYNPGGWLDPCLNSLLDSSLKTDIIIIDNGSTDNTINKIKNNFNCVRLIQNKKNKGFGAANNQGLQIAINENYDFAFLLNQDAWVKPDTLEVLVDKSLNNQGFGIVSPIHLNGEGTKLDKKFSLYIGPKNCDFFSDLIVKEVVQDIYNLNFINAAAWLISKKCLETVGGFNPSFFHYGEDDNYCQRVVYHGFKIGLVPKSYIYHDREERSTNVYFDKFKESYKRILILKLSNPNLKNSKSIKSLLLRDIIKKTMFFQFKAAFSLISIANELKFKSINKNKEYSMSKNGSFLKLEK